MRIQDLTEVYKSEEDAVAIRAIGWLGTFDAATARPPVDVPFFSKLIELLADPWAPRAAAGRHRCAMCRFTGGPSGVEFEGTRVSVGSGVLVVPGDGAVYYITPTLVAHYVDAHDYNPPAEFRDAVMNCPPMRSIAYLRAVARARHALLGLDL